MNKVTKPTEDDFKCENGIVAKPKPLFDRWKNKRNPRDKVLRRDEYVARFSERSNSRWPAHYDDTFAYTYCRDAEH